MGEIIEFPRRVNLDQRKSASMSLADLDRMLRRVVPPMPKLPCMEIFERIDALMAPYLIPMPSLIDNILERV